MKMINKLIVPVTASALLLGACGASATDSKENTLISSKAGDVTVADTMKKIGKDQIANASFTEMLNKILADNIKIKLMIRRLTNKLKKCKSNTAVKINLKRPFNSKV